MKQRNAERRQSKAGLFSTHRPTKVSDRALLPAPVQSYAWPPYAHPKLQAIGRRKHRIFAVELVRRTRAGDLFEAVVLGAMRAAFPRSNNIGDEATRERGLKLANTEPIRGVVLSLLGGTVDDV